MAPLVHATPVQRTHPLFRKRDRDYDANQKIPERSQCRP
eukprot:CAMPEP_0119128940 /NCGR_PEP_ID=MMETSP1310-20130426/6896_1 /TAXON_ID=464262 /ORGANISM="Genus nov. species nov., Strain RCC2339" /LENGTH=38 /DNA_ID= /DNA_START= /DNA_END= /DNA_ORIENTATION=